MRGGGYVFLKSFALDQSDALKDEIEEFLLGLGTKHEFGWALGSQELPSGYPSSYLDIYPKGLVEKYRSFGSLFVRLWIVGKDPMRLLSGIFVGAERAQQSGPRRAATYARNRLSELLDPLERQRQYQYKTWGDSDIWWCDEGVSVRAVTRQLEQFITYKASDLNDGTYDGIEVDVGELVRAVDGAIDALEPIREFGKDVLLLYFGENLPPAPLVTGGFGEGPQAAAPSKVTPHAAMEPEVDWFAALPSKPDLGDLKGLQSAYEKLVAALAAGKHALLLGAPGVGKTELAEAVCRLIPRPYDVVTATSDWTSIHTIGGYMPVPDAATGNEPLDFVPGVFTEAMANEKWLIIDEMNRADIDKAFGEMFTLLGGKRKSILLPYRKRQPDGSYRRVVLGQANTEAEHHLYNLSPSWRLIGTMNTFDKASLFQMSFAFARRVAVIELAVPDEATYHSILSTGADALISDDSDDGSFREAVLNALARTFASEAESGLGSLGLRVGPAIPLDIIKFVARMRRFTSDPSLLVLTGLEMYLFPQFEGRHEQTAEIASAIAVALGMKELPVETLVRLRTFTGAID